jgi:hypothetical protein
MPSGNVQLKSFHDTLDFEIWHFDSLFYFYYLFIYIFIYIYTLYIAKIIPEIRLPNSWKVVYQL